MKPTWPTCYRILIALLLCLPTSAASATLTGTVKDLGRAAAPGVSGVSVFVYLLGPGGTKITTRLTGLTDGTGLYRIENVPQGVLLNVVFDRNDYLERYKSIRAALTKDPTKLEDIFLKENTNDVTYNARVADRLAQYAANGQYDHLGLLQDESVPAGQRLALRAELEKRMTKAGLDFAVAKFVAHNEPDLFVLSHSGRGPEPPEVAWNLSTTTTTTTKKASAHCKVTSGSVASKDDTAKSFTVHPKTGSDMTFITNDNTSYAHGKKHSTWADLATGDNVHVTCMMDATKLVAKSVKLSTPKAASTDSGMKH